MGKARERSSNSTLEAKAADLERIRNNQRRSRARRKEYIAELEEKIRSYENSGGRSFGDTRLRQLANENELLKRLLQSLGLTEDFLKAYTKASLLASDVSQDQLNDKSCCSTGCLSLEKSSATKPPDEASELYPQGWMLNLELDNQAFSVDSYEANTVVPWDSFDTSAIPLQTEAGFQQPIAGPIATPITDEPVAEQQEGLIPLGDTLESTTLCSVAFSLIMKNNRKGYTAADLNFKLQTGYRNSSRGSDGCRVDNKVLFGVLAEIA